MDGGGFGGLYGGLVDGGDGYVGGMYVVEGG